MKIKEIIDLAETERFRWCVFSVDKDTSKPIFISLQNNYNNEFKCMLDSGASIPVWCSGIKSLKLAFPKAELCKNLKGLLSGFGNGFEVVDVYYIPSVVLSNGKDMIAFNHAYLPVVNKNSFGANLILPSSVFKNANILLSQMQSLPEKQLVFQCHSLWYKMRFMKRKLNPELLGKLKKAHKLENVSDEDFILGSDGELGEELVQLELEFENLFGLTEGVAEEEQKETVDEAVVPDEDIIAEELMRKGSEIMKDL